jgi:hypothetical protein
MDTATAQMMRMADKGYSCGQILICMALEAKGRHNQDLVRAAGGLIGGCGTGICTCGVLIGGGCLLSLFAGKGSDEEEWHPSFPQMIQDLTSWFQNTFGKKYGGIDCNTIRNARDPEADARQRCRKIAVDTYFKTREILKANGFNLDSKR